MGELPMVGATGWLGPTLLCCCTMPCDHQHERCLHAECTQCQSAKANLVPQSDGWKAVPCPAGATGAGRLNAHISFPVLYMVGASLMAIRHADWYSLSLQSLPPQHCYKAWRGRCKAVMMSIDSGRVSCFPVQ